MTNPTATETAVSERSKNGISFGFAKRSASTKKLQDSRLGEAAVKAEEIDFVVGVSRKGIEGSKSKSPPKNLVIPCAGNRNRLLEVKGAGNGSDFTCKADREAASELLKESAEWLQRTAEDTDVPSSSKLTIPLTQEGKEKEALNQDLATRAEVSTLDDYEAVPVQGFGMGMLRGMGFKKEEGIGGFKKVAVACIEPNIRPKGLGLGATKPNSAGKGKHPGSTGRNDGAEDAAAAVRKGCFVAIEGGAHKSCYGTVEGLDEETARLVVKLSVGGESVSVSENVVRVVSKEEYKKFGRVINKDEYERYAEKQRCREEKRHRKRRRAHSRSPSRSSSAKKTPPRRPEGGPTWLRPQLIVRLVDKGFKDGKYYNCKVVVDDVVSPDICVVRTEDGRILENVDPAACETVIPKHEMAIVMFVRGKWKGRLAQILGRDKRSCRAAVQVLPDKRDVLKIDYDDICEFAGDINLC